MFVAAEFQAMRRLCLEDLEALLEKFSIPIPVDWNGDEYHIYEDLDAELTREICGLMHSSSIIEGYTNLLKLGGISYDYSETDNELLDKIILNGDKILAAVRVANVEYDSWQATWGNVSPLPERSEVLNVEAFDLKPFDAYKLISKFDKIKTSYNKLLPSAREAVDRCIAEAENLRGVFELKNEIPFEDIPELLRKLSMSLRDGKERTICLRIKKNVQFQVKNIPPAPQEPSFTVREVEDALKILIQVNEIIKKI